MSETATVEPPQFPPLMRGQGAATGADPFELAIKQAVQGADPGLVVWSQDQTAIRAALVLAPEMPLARAMGAVLAVELGFADALGALAPPEVAVHIVWPDRFKVNAALCGQVRAAASTTDPQAEPGWLVLGLDVPVLPDDASEPGLNPDRTNLYEEGCGDLDPHRVIESWSRHTMGWLHRLLDEGVAPLHAAWRAKCDTLGKPVDSPHPGRFAGLDEDAGMLLELEDGKMTVIPLSEMLGARP
jgi:BirA family biotin operon repressor/biotin-[acetyl-CoA-carboxylase] ligase